VIDRYGNVVFELPYAECQVYGAGEGRIFLYAGIGNKNVGGFSSEYVLMEMTFMQGTWSCLEKGTESTLAFGLNVPGYRFLLAKNDESVIISEGSREGKVKLEQIDGTVLEEDANELTLLEDGLYLVVNQVIIDGRGVREARLKYQGEDVSGVYENLDRLSEEYIAFCKDGKWGYLKLERE